MNLAGIKYQAAMRHGDIIHVSWVLDCCAQKRLIHLQPKLVFSRKYVCSRYFYRSR